MSMTINEGERKNIEVTMLPWGRYFTIPVDMDIKPNNDENVVSCTNEKGMIPVVIITTDNFDATTVNVNTLEFGPGKAGVAHSDARHVEDISGDGKDDLMLHFRFEETGLDCESKTAELFGQTVAGDEIEGVDNITMLNNKKSVVEKIQNLFK